MSDTTARRVNVKRFKQSVAMLAEMIYDDPYGTHVLVTVEEWERLRGIIAARDQYACEAYKRITELEETIRQSHRELMQAGMGDTTTARRLEDALGAIASQTINEKRSADDE